MNAERWKLVDELLQSALEMDPERRESMLQQACAGDPELLDEVKSLLTSHRRAGDFLLNPAAQIAAHAITSAEEPSPTRSLEGQLVAPYRILKMIGRGGHGNGLARRALRWPL